MTNKTMPGQVSLESYLSTLGENRLEEALALIDMMRDITGKEPVMWGSSIIGFGARHYVYESGHEGDEPLLGFSPRKAKISLYITYDASQYEADLAAVGRHTVGKGCIYISKLADVDLALLRALISKAYMRTMAGKHEND